MTTLYYIAHKNSAKSKNYLAVTNNEMEAHRLVEKLSGATGVVEKRYNNKWELQQ